MSVKYLVEKEETCQKCNGKIFVQHPAWAEYWKRHVCFEPTEARSIKWFEENGFSDALTRNPLMRRSDGLPDKEIICPDCDGQGTKISQVDLEVAMRDLGFMVGLTDSAEPIEPEPCQHAYLKYDGISTEIGAGVLITILRCAICGLEVVIPGNLNWSKYK